MEPEKRQQWQPRFQKGKYISRNKNSESNFVKSVYPDTLVLKTLCFSLRDTKSKQPSGNGVQVSNSTLEIPPPLKSLREQLRESNEPITGE